MIQQREPAALRKARIELNAEQSAPEPNLQLIKHINIRIDRLEDQHHSKRWQVVDFQDLPVGQVFKFNRTMHKSEYTLEIQPKLHYAMKSQGCCAIIVSKGMDQGALVNLAPRRPVYTKGR